MADKHSHRFFRYLFAFLLIGVGVGAVFIATSALTQNRASQEKTQLADYSWEELHNISQEIANTPSQQDALQVAKKYHLVDDSGNICDQVKEVKLSDGNVIHVRIVGIKQDTRSDDKKPAGLSFMTCEAIAQRPMSDNAENKVNWSNSSLRTWLSNDGLALLPDDLQKQIVLVDKKSNVAAYSLKENTEQDTQDKLWCFSPKEVCGNVMWFEDEYKSLVFNEAKHYNAALNLGEQYQYFVQSGVSQKVDPNHVLKASYQGKDLNWWYRCSLPYVNTEALKKNVIFYQVMQNGYPYGHNAPNTTAGVVVGFCI